MEIVKNKGLALICFYLSCGFFQPASSLRSENVNLFQLSEDNSEWTSNVYSKRSPRSIADDITNVEGENEGVCKLQWWQFLEARERLKRGARLEETHVFVNETKNNLMLTWASRDNMGVMIVLLTQEGLFSSSSSLWRSTDHGRSFIDISNQVDRQAFREHDGLQRNPHDAALVYLVSNFNYLYVTEDGGKNWRKALVAETEESKQDVTVPKILEFHPDKPYAKFVAIVSNKRELIVTYDNFETQPKVIQENVNVVKWGTYASNCQYCLFATVGDFVHPFFSEKVEMFDLLRYNRSTNMWKTVLQRVTDFDVQGRFIFATVFKNEYATSMKDEKQLMISSDAGNNWNEARLPTILGDRSYSVLEMSGGFVFLHVDNFGETGIGTLYKSSSGGVIFSESLRHHLLPFDKYSELYKVESIRGVYLTSQVMSDNSIRTLITYNKGGQWTNISRPVGLECKNSGQKGCFLQIHNRYSIFRGIKAQPPLSTEEAVGILLAHGHVASNLQTTDPDIYLSSDGGWKFRKVLKGPHFYEIADSGGLLVAVPMEGTSNIIKFSTDEGYCWHVYKFTSDPIKVTGVLTEPGSKSMVVSIWGYNRLTKEWTVNVVDFSKVIQRKCMSEVDYETWIPHTSLKNESSHEGCLLGKRETFKRIKPGSWCCNGYMKTIERTVEYCTCSEEDYECDFGFYKPEGSTKCVLQPDIQAEDIGLCEDGHLLMRRNVGYRLVQGTECTLNNDFEPSIDLAELEGLCEPENFHHLKKNAGNRKLFIIATVSASITLVVMFGAVVIYYMVKSGSCTENRSGKEKVAPPC